ncbi:UNVERIFIED_CONTAM: hypothetical protein GTU68_028525 [Idotea baltica]|nr:hypothetical protein [Idotea baltica]
MAFVLNSTKLESYVTRRKKFSLSTSVKSLKSKKKPTKLSLALKKLQIVMQKMLK